MFSMQMNRSIRLPARLTAKSEIFERRFKHSNRAVPRAQSQQELASVPTYQFAGDRSQALKKKYRIDVYTWGFTGTGALGDERYLAINNSQNGRERHISTRMMIRRAPTRLRDIELDTKVCDIAAGSGFSVIAATVHNLPHLLFGCGLNTDSQIGLQIASNREPLLCVGNLAPIALPIAAKSTGTSKERILKLAAGRAHTVCLSNHARVFTLGNNSFGQCARPIVREERYFGSSRITEVHQLASKLRDGDKVVEVVCGQDHTLLLTLAGRVYSCGWGADGQLGNGSFESSGELSLLCGDIEGEKIVALSCAADCVLALNDRGQLFGWGNSEYSQLGMATSEAQVCVPRHLPLPDSVGKVISVAAAGSMCGLVNESGRVFTWGFGHLGFGPSVSWLKKPTALDANLFGKSVFDQESARVKTLVAGLAHFAAITHRGDLYVWGRNNRANLGTGAEADVLFPYKISIPGNVYKVSLGHDHSIAMTRAIV